VPPPWMASAVMRVTMCRWRPGNTLSPASSRIPETIFFLEGLGGAWEATEALLGEGGMQWAYSELFQNYSPSRWRVTWITACVKATGQACW